MSDTKKLAKAKKKEDAKVKSKAEKDAIEAQAKAEEVQKEKEKKDKKILEEKKKEDKEKKDEAEKVKKKFVGKKIGSATISKVVKVTNNGTEYNDIFTTNGLTFRLNDEDFKLQVSK